MSDARRSPPLFTSRLERAMRWAAVCHLGQERHGSDTPYVEHLMAVALILDRLGYDEEVVVAGLLHDAVEDTDVTIEDVEARFGARVAAIVAGCSERKTDGEGKKRPWIDRKSDHIEALAQATTETRAVLLADKLHNLLTMQVDLGDGRPVWSLFHADRDQVLWYYRTILDRFGAGDDRLESLAAECRRVLAEIEALGAPVAG